MDQSRLNFFKNYEFLKTNEKKSKFNYFFKIDIKFDIKLLTTDSIYSSESYFAIIKQPKNNKKINQFINSKNIYNKLEFKKHSIYF